MRKIQVVALFAVALGAVCAQTASAVEWLLNGAEATALATTTEYELDAIEMGQGTEVLCNGSFVGTTGPGAAGEITEIVGLAGEKVTKANELNETSGFLKCTFTVAKPCESSMAPEVFPIDLPWKTTVELIINSASKEEIVDKITSGIAGKEPGYEYACLTLLTLIFTTCSGNTALLLENLVTDVGSEFDSTDSKVTPVVKCEGALGTGEGLLQSTGGLTVVMGGLLSVSGE